MKTVTFETAKLANKVGFKEECEQVWNIPTKTQQPAWNFYSTGRSSNHAEDKLNYSSPTQTALQKWLIEKGYFASVEYSMEDEWVSTLTFLESNQKDYWDEHIDSFEDSLEHSLFIALTYLLKEQL